MKRYACVVEYDGSAFCGWQRQASERTVQAVIEHALTQVAAEPIRVFCAGRTDAGVHAEGQVIHFDSAIARSLQAWERGANSLLPDDVVIRSIQPVSMQFHARFSAVRRRYRYLICNRPSRPALSRSSCSWVRAQLREELMQEALQALLGTHDFSAFRASGCQAKTPIKTLFEARVSRQDDWIAIDLCADAFLYRMVRIVTGLLIEIGLAKQLPSYLAERLQMRQRDTRARLAAPGGLRFMGPFYPLELGFRSPIAAPVVADFC